MDNAVSNHLIKALLINAGAEAGAEASARVDIDNLQMRFVAESSCRFLRPLKYPHEVDVGLRVTKLGNSAVTYSIGMFESIDGPFNGDRGADELSETLAALGTFVHVYVDAEQKPQRIADDVRAALESLQ